MTTLTPAVANATRLFAILSVAVCLVPAGAHLFEMPNKLALSPAEYMIVQRIYDSWALFGFAVLAALAFTLGHTCLVPRRRAAWWLSLASFTAILVTQVIFWSYTFPMNRLTENWTVMPPDLEAVRRQWEYSHAANAVITFAALVAIVASILAQCRSDNPVAADRSDWSVER